MTITSETNRYSYAGDDSTVAFAFSSRFLVNADLTVILVNDTTGVGVTQVLDTDYTVSGAGDAGGGTVTMTTAPATGETLEIFSDPTLTQETDLEAGGPLPAESVESALDKSVLQNKRTREIALQAIHIPDEDGDLDMVLPNRVDRANMVSGFDSDGLPKNYSPNDPSFETFTASRALESDASGMPSASAVTSVELARLSGVTGVVQTQLDAKAASTHASQHQDGGADEVAVATPAAAAIPKANAYANLEAWHPATRGQASSDTSCAASTATDINGLTALTLPTTSSVSGRTYEVEFSIAVDPITSDAQQIVGLYNGTTGDKGDTLVGELRYYGKAATGVQLCGQFTFTPGDDTYTKFGLVLTSFSTGGATVKGTSNRVTYIKVTDITT